MLLKCPKCNDKTISWWKKWWSSKGRPVTCTTCGVKSYKDFFISSFFLGLEQIMFFVVGYWALWEFTILSLIVFLVSVVLGEFLRIYMTPLEIRIKTDK